jgi:hypothetical protein
MNCTCGGMFAVIRIEEYPDNLSSIEKLHYNRVCDVKCLSCGESRYSQPYDSGEKLNIVRKNTKNKESKI